MDLRIIFITELLSVEVQVVLEVLSACQVAIKYLIRFIWALGDPEPKSLSTVLLSVPGVHTPHLLTFAPQSVISHSPVFIF